MRRDVHLEIAGQLAMFARPDTKPAPVSYPAPTWSAAKGIFESIAKLRSAYISPVKVEVCRPIQYCQFTTNYGGPLRKSNQIAKGAAFQRVQTVLYDVRYRLYGEVVSLVSGPEAEENINKLRGRFIQWLAEGRCLHTPFLGQKQFTPSYVGPLLSATSVQQEVNLDIPSMLQRVFEMPRDDGAFRPEYRQNVRIESGVLHYAQ